VLTVVITGVLGSAIGVYAAMKAPKVYPVHALILSQDHAKQPSRITRLRAELVASDLDLEHRWGVPFEQAANEVAESVTLKPTPEGLSVNVVTSDYKDSRSIARAIAEELRTPEHEAALAAKWKGIRDITLTDQGAIADVVQLEELLTDQAITAGFDSYSMVIKEAAKGDENAAALTRGEDFTRRQTMMQDLTKKLGFNLPPGVPVLASDNPVQAGPFGIEQASEDSKRTVEIGRMGGLLAGGLLVWALLRWKPAFLRPVPRTELTPVPSAGSGTPAPNDDPW